MSNRVEELESKVAELQAAVNGLTEELVETKERLRQLEDANDVQVPSRAATRRGDWETEDEADAEAAAAEPADADETSPADADETKPDEADETDEGDGETPDDDIIVA
ncbi:MULTISPECIES: chromosome segregation protein SMC [unclassified Haloferax]|uniref:Chromosome segregation protein SMC n=1 Tax=Haloferax sp. Atlit-48N TaxID=2077198 RepID=A0ACD5HX29_9EURY|nr:MULTISPECIES: chromosome segregation protein SMC [unclassified Haloferax]MBC9985484.1 chromosome segregation protein SMC [Haloferax sp. AS1]RDZ33128.1 chromosome segregation protein SMC [Haloferax sp. Atlit-48N]RDZ37182.1 chromosome segregation protein SMC [Haloferax sp. Atlit-24N]RDZ41316.1 chromosome segregation protein SMC [Haloferax sp. Atlit-47N]RLM37979.1 chromosome segregation protein SMC [Haloferax sp. Atlit-109R]